MDSVAKKGYLSDIVWLHKNRTEGCTTDAMDWAARNGHLEVIKELEKEKEKNYSNLCLIFHNNKIPNDLFRNIFEFVC